MEENGDFYVNIWRKNLRFNGQVRLACPCFCSYSSSAWAGLRADVLLASKNDVTAQNLFSSKSNHPTKLQRSTNQPIITKHSPRQQWKPDGLRESPEQLQSASGAWGPAAGPRGLRCSRLSTGTVFVLPAEHTRAAGPIPTLHPDGAFVLPPEHTRAAGPIPTLHADGALSTRPAAPCTVAPSAPHNRLQGRFLPTPRFPLNSGHSQLPPPRPCRPHGAPRDPTTRGNLLPVPLRAGAFLWNIPNPCSSFNKNTLAS